MNWASNNSNHCSTAKKRKYVVIGLALHCIADTYAHRTKVAKYVIDNTSENAALPFSTDYASGNSSDFASYIYMGDFKTSGNYNWNSLYNKYGQDKTIPFTSLIDYLNPIRPDNNSATPNTEYVDKPDFCRERFRAALDSCNDFFGQITVSNNSQFNVDVIAQYTNVNLIHYSTYHNYYN